MKKKILKFKCKKCGVIDLDMSVPFCESDEEGFIVPVAYCKSLQALSLFYTSYMGENYQKTTGNKMKDDFEKTWLELNHQNPDEDGEGWKEHKCEPILCWRMMM